MSIVITKQPQNATVPIGTVVSFSVEAAGEGLTYQWEFRNVIDFLWQISSMDGNQTPTITVEATEGRNRYQYRCVVTDNNGNSVASDAASLIIAAESIFTVQPTSYRGPVGLVAIFSVETAEEGLTYQWQFWNPNTSYWADSGMTGSTTASITVEATAARNGYKYRCVATNAEGTKMNSNPALLIIDESAAFLVQPAGLKAIGDAIRAKTGTSDKMTITQMVDAINAL